MSNNFKIFQKLHHSTKILALPNAWDAGSAKVFESVGAEAIATTSAGVAWSLGYPDGRVLPAEVGVSVAKSMVRVLNVPLTFDVEHGYSDDPNTVADNILRLIDVGVAGINIEDGPDQPAVLARKIEAIKNKTSKAGVNIFINARTDVYLASLAPEARRVQESISRANQYGAAGADSVFVPAIAKDEDIRNVAAGTTLPLNVLAWTGLADADKLFQLGARRLSAGSGISQVLWGIGRNLAKDFLVTGSSTPMLEKYMAHGELQGLFTKK